jgi:hypothetical protein
MTHEQKEETAIAIIIIVIIITTIINSRINIALMGKLNPTQYKYKHISGNEIIDCSHTGCNINKNMIYLLCFYDVSCVMYFLLHILNGK